MYKMGFPKGHIASTGARMPPHTHRDMLQSPLLLVLWGKGVWNSHSFNNSIGIRAFCCLLVPLWVWVLIWSSPRFFWGGADSRLCRVLKTVLGKRASDYKRSWESAIHCNPPPPPNGEEIPTNRRNKSADRFFDKTASH